MADYIDRKELLVKVAGYCYTIKDVLNVLNEMPSVDVVEQKHGHWIVDNSRHFLPYKCTACGEWNDGTTKYCPECGAEMIEEVTE